MNSPKVSIITLTYNRPQFLKRAIQSALSQDFADWELLVIDDGLDQRVEKIVKENFGDDMRIQYFKPPMRTRIAGASNFGLHRVHGEYVAILDDDDYWATPTKIGKQVAYLDAHHDVVGCGGGYILIDEQDDEEGRYLKSEHDADIRRNALAANPMINSTTLFRRVVAERVGGYDESLLEFADWDFWLKMGLAGRLYNFPEYFLYYRIWEEGASLSRQRAAAKSAFQILRRYRGKYPGYLKGMAGTAAYSVHARLPMSVKKYSSPFFSRLKKLLFSGGR